MSWEWLWGWVPDDLTAAQASVLTSAGTLLAALLALLGVVVGVWTRERNNERERWWQRVRWLGEQWAASEDGALPERLIVACSASIPNRRGPTFLRRMSSLSEQERRMLDAIPAGHLERIPWAAREDIPEEVGAT